MALTPQEQRQLLLDLTSGRISKAEYDEIIYNQTIRDVRTSAGAAPIPLTEAEKRLFERANSPINDRGFSPRTSGNPDQSLIPGVPQKDVDQIIPPQSEFGPSIPIDPETGFPFEGDEMGVDEEKAFMPYMDTTDAMGVDEEKIFNKALEDQKKKQGNQGGSGGGSGGLYIVVGQPGSYTIREVDSGNQNEVDSGMSKQAAQETADALNAQFVDSASDSSSDSGSDGSGESGSDESQSFTNSQIWEYNDQKYVVWQIPNTMMFMRYLATDEELDQFYSGRQRPDVITPTDDSWTSSIYFGNVFELDDDVITGGNSPFFGFVDNFEKATKGRPWLKDDDEMFALWVEGYVEDRQITEEEWGETEWFNNATAEERSWLILSKGRGIGDADFPADAARKLEQDRIYWTKVMKDSGISNAETIRGANGETFAQWFAEQVTFGKLDVTKASEQIRGLSDATSGVQIEDYIQNWLEGKGEVAQTRTGYASARNLALKWLGPVYGSLDDETLARYAGIIRNAENPDVGAELLAEELKAQRKVLFSSDLYDENLTYEQIAAPWLNYSTRVLGERIDEKSEHWLNILLKNDQVEADKEITAYGLNNNIAKVVDDLSDEVALSVGVSESGVQRGFST